MAQGNQPEGTNTHTWLEVIKAIGPLLIVGTIIVGIWRFQVEREREAASRYQNIIRDLGNDSNSVRAGAVITMDSYLRQGDKINKKYREQGIYVLATHLAIESKPLVRSTTEEVLVNIGVSDDDDIVVRKLACSNRHLWEQEKEDDPNLDESAVIYKGGKVSKNLQSITNTMIEVLRRRTNKASIQNPPDRLDMSETYLMSGGNSVELRGDELKGVDLKNIELNKACMAKMNFEKCTMENCNLSKAHLDHAILTEAKFLNVILDDANLVGARCEGANFNNTSLNNANLSLAILQGANLKSAKLGGADLNGANLMTLLLFDINSSKFQSDLNEGTISQDLRQEFTNNRISFSESATVSIEEKDHRWLIRDKGKEQTYTVRKEERLIICKGPTIEETEMFSINSNETKRYQSDLDKGTISRNMRKKFKDNYVNLSDNAAISVKEKGRVWLINDKDNGQTYIVAKEEWLDICKETRFDFDGIKNAIWENAIFDYDVWQKLSSSQE